MPAPFHPEDLRTSLSALDLQQACSPHGRAYQGFYGLDFSTQAQPINSCLGCFEVGGYQVVAQVWWPEQPVATLFLLHGFYDHMGLYRHVVAWALAMGYAVISCDLPGHGLSSGPRASIADFAEYQTVLQQLFVEAARLALPQPWHLFGQSTGAAIVVDHLLHHGADSPAQGQTILFSPLVRPRAWGKAKLTYQVLRHFVPGIKRQFSNNSGDTEFLAFLREQDLLQPLMLPTAWVGALSQWITRIETASVSSRSPLLVQGEADQTVEWRHNVPLLERKFNITQKLMLPHAKHHLANELPEFRDKYFAFLRERLA